MLKIELMQDNEYNLATCNCVELMADGKSIISGWTDGRIRSFLPQSGKLYWIIQDAHINSKNAFGGVTCICATQDCENVVSAGTDGEIKLWNIGKQVKKL